MSCKNWLGESMARDARVCIHLFHKIPASLHSWRPSEKQRSVEELLRYLSICGISSLKGFLEPDKGWRDVYLARMKEFPIERFPEVMEDQAREIEEYFRDVATETLGTREVKMPWGETLTLGFAILNGPAKWLPAYKMQLFLYAKQNGIALSTPNLWRGVDPVA